jgi:hypothetical protein
LLPCFFGSDSKKSRSQAQTSDFKVPHSELFEIALVLVRLDYIAPELDGSLRRGRLTSSPPQFGQTKFVCSAQLPQYVHS